MDSNQKVKSNLEYRKELQKVTDSKISEAKEFLEFPKTKISRNLNRIINDLDYLVKGKEKE